MLDKIGFVAEYKGRSVNSHVLVLIRQSIKTYEEEHGTMDGTLDVAFHVKPSRNKIYLAEF